MKTFKFYMFALLAIPLFVASCKKDKDEEEEQKPPTTCKATKGYSYDPQTGTIEDSIMYIYNGDQVTKLDAPGSGFVTFEYTNNKVTKRSIYDYSTPTVPDYYEVLSYNTDGTLQKIDYFTGGPGSAKFLTATFTYTAGKYNKVVISENDGSGTFTTTSEYIYTYTGNNITGVVENDYTVTPTDTYSYGYTFDTNVNYLTKQSPQFMFTDPFFGEFDPTILPMLVSANNATAITVMGTPVATFDYTLDAKGNLTRINFGGKPLVAYSYLCQ
jgi:hypothetical protein